MRSSKVGLAACWLILMLVVASQGQASVVSDEECASCHGKAGLRPSRARSYFIDFTRYRESAHGERGMKCISCHEEITAIDRGKRVPHRLGIKLTCAGCHEKEDRDYAKSRHAKVSDKKCCCCHDPHYTLAFRQMPAEDRKMICLMCHSTEGTHLWLPQKELHFNSLGCTPCHDLDARIGMVISVVDTNKPAGQARLGYKELAPFVEHGKEGVAQTLDQDGNGSLSKDEIATFIKRLQKNGIPGAILRIRILVLESTHNFTHLGEKAGNCSLCHSKNPSFYSTLILEVPDKGDELAMLPVATEILPAMRKESLIEDVYVLGESKVSRKDLEDLWGVVKRIGIKWVDIIGCFFIVATAVAVYIHLWLMFLTRKVRKAAEEQEDVETHPVPIRVWHWIHGLCVIVLLLTGIQLRVPDVVPLFANLLNAVNLHNLCAKVLVADYAFWVAYQIWKREFKTRFYIAPRHFLRDVIETFHYYTYLIFHGESFPKDCGNYVDFDPLERGNYVTAMVFVLPVQIFTGVLLLEANSMTTVIGLLGGLRYVATLHVICAYFWVPSMIIHVYLWALKKYRRASSRKAAT